MKDAFPDPTDEEVTGVSIEGDALVQPAAAPQLGSTGLSNRAGKRRSQGEGQMSHFSTTFLVDKTPEEVFWAINNVRGWWGEDVQGSNDKIGDEFTYRVQDIHYSRLRVIDLVSNERVVWLVVDNRMKFVEDQTEWVGTKISFEIVPKDGHTEVRFAHIGLEAGYECFDVCSTAWSSLMHSSLPSLITTGAGHPYK